MKETEPTVLNKQIEPSHAIAAVDDIVARTRGALTASRVALLSPMLGLAFFSAACLDIEPSDKPPTPAVPAVAEAPKQPAGSQITETKPATPTATRTPEVIQRSSDVPEYVWNSWTKKQQTAWIEEGRRIRGDSPTPVPRTISPQPLTPSLTPDIPINPPTTSKSKSPETPWLAYIGGGAVAVLILYQMARIPIWIIKKVFGGIGKVRAMGRDKSEKDITKEKIDEFDHLARS